MGLGSLRALVRDLNFATFGVDATVIRPLPEDDTPIDTKLIWITAEPNALPGPFESQRQNPLRIAALPLNVVPTVPKGTRITAPPAPGADDAGWITDGESRREADHVRVLVVEDPDWYAS